ncbi:hypothetical protein HPP92_016631 [Vanilla planifolia]|uniref:Pectinesterase inhibitor domain-containing protein n=1 Tax=Vanilla planifolia TaxID=51239 RepID=A0A835QF56_VANPL|nr:hypothetical protein HPP92_016631 [Vanilla planifolia]
MRPAFPLLFLFLLSLSYSLLHPCTSLCVPLRLLFPISAISHLTSASPPTTSPPPPQPRPKASRQGRRPSAPHEGGGREGPRGPPFAQRLSADPATGAKIRDLLRNCIDTYDDALDNLEAANEAVRAGDAGTRDAMLSAMISNFGTCEDGFQEFTVKSPMAHWSQTLQNMTDNCLAIFNMDRPNEDYE